MMPVQMKLHGDQEYNSRYKIILFLNCKFNIMEVKEIIAPSVIAYTIRTKDTMQSMGKYIGKLFSLLRKEKLKFGGTVLCVYHEVPQDGQPCDFEMGVSIKGNIPQNNQNIKTIGGMKCLTIQHKGSYSKLKTSYDFMRNYVKENKVDIAGTPFEIYSKGPIFGFIMIPALLVTDIYFPIK